MNELRIKVLKEDFKVLDVKKIDDGGNDSERKSYDDLVSLKAGASIMFKTFRTGSHCYDYFCVNLTNEKKNDDRIKSFFIEKTALAEFNLIEILSTHQFESLCQEDTESINARAGTSFTHEELRKIHSFYGDRLNLFEHELRETWCEENEHEGLGSGRYYRRPRILTE